MLVRSGSASDVVGTQGRERSNLRRPSPRLASHSQADWRIGMRASDGKYETAARLPAAEETLAEAFRELRMAVSRHACLVGGTFSFADVAMAVALQFVEPVADRYIRLGPATRRAWTNERFRHDYADLLAWRDMVYELHRPRASAGVTGPMPGRCRRRSNRSRRVSAAAYEGMHICSFERPAARVLNWMRIVARGTA